MHIYVHVGYVRSHQCSLSIRKYGGSGSKGLPVLKVWEQPIKASAYSMIRFWPYFFLGIESRGKGLIGMGNTYSNF